MDSILQDIRYGARMLIKNPGIALISVFAFALGIGLTTTAFSIVYGALHRGLPFDEPQSLLHLERNNLSEDIESMGVPIHDFLDWREQQQSFEGLAAWYQGTVNVAGSEGRPERYDGAFISANAFRLVRESAAIGRTFQDGEDDPHAEPVLLLSHNVWRDRFGADPDAVGRTVRMNGELATIVGVMPEGFAFPESEQVWTPLRMDALELERGDGISLEVFGRLIPGTTIDQARAEFAAIAKRLAAEYPETNEGVGSVIKPYTEEFIGSEPTVLLYTMLATVSLVLLIACVNVANLLLSRAAVRTKEIAVRTALGASRRRVVMQLLAEAFVISAAGGMFGLALGWVGVDLFNRSIVDTGPPFWIDIRIDAVAVGFVVGLVVFSSLIAGIIPALQASGANANEVLKDESRGSSSLRMGRISKALVMAEIALSLGLLVAAGLTAKSVTKLRNIDYGFATERIFTARIGLFEADYPDDASRIRFYEALHERLLAVPGVQSAAVTTNLPGTGSGRWRFAPEGETFEREQDYPLARRVVVAPRFFDTFEVGMLQGRDFGLQDDADALPVAIVNESFASRFYSGESAIGRRFRVGTEDSEEPWLSIIGVAPDMFMGGPDNENPEGFYVPMAQNAARFMSLAIRSDGDPMALTPIVKDEVEAIDQNLPIYFVNSLGGVIRRSTWFYYVFGTLFMIFGGAALFLAAVGLYGVMAFSVSRRTKEMGVRMALGAQGRDVLRLILRQGLWQLGIGTAFGLALAALIGRGLEVILFEVEPFDPVIFVAIVLVLGSTAMLASLVPARRATRVDPIIALRYE